jgi:hypothetical protein
MSPTTDERFPRGSFVTVEGWVGIACIVEGPEREDREDSDWSGVQYRTGKLNLRMVGDDRTFAFDPDQLTLIGDDEFCSGCGQIGCGH